VTTKDVHRKFLWGSFTGI